MTVGHHIIRGWKKPIVGQESIRQLLQGVGVSGQASWRGFRRDRKDDDLTGV